MSIARPNGNRGLIHWFKAALLAALIVICCACRPSVLAQSAPPSPVQTQPNPIEPGPTVPSPTAQAPTAQAPTAQEPATQQTPAPATTPATESESPTPLKQAGLPDAPKPATPKPAATEPASQFAASMCAKLPCPTPIINWYMRFENGPQVKPLTPMEKGWLATKNVIDPFNVITILGEAGISVAADSHSPYGPGMPGWGRYVGVSFTQDITGEFFNTFLIPSIAHQDPHYHRMPHASYPHRIVHAIDQVVWTQGDNGKGMLNYANLVGFGIDDEISNLYVPGRETNAGASAQRYAIGLATAPIDNFITEFLPDVARHVHVEIVVIQRIINQVASKDGGS